VAFPTRESVTETQFSTASTTHNVSMPATVDAGDLLIVIISIKDSASNTFTTPSGWTAIANDDNAPFVHQGIFAKDADGTEDSTTVNFATSSAATGCAQCYRISGWGGTLASDLEAGTYGPHGGTAPNPPSLTPTGGAKDYLWMGDTSLRAY